MNRQKVVTKPAPESFNPGAKAGVQENFNCFKNTGFRLESIPHLMRDRNDLIWVLAVFYEFIKINFHIIRLIK